MIKKGIIKTKRTAAINGKHNGTVLSSQKKKSILDFAGAWNELPNEKLKALDAALQNRRKTARRANL